MRLREVPKLILLLMGSAALLSTACSTVKSVLAINNSGSKLNPIANPFDQYSPSQAKQENIVLRTKKGDRSLEVEIPGGTADMTDFVIPVAPAFREGKQQALNDESGIDEKYKDKSASMTDREITRQFASVSIAEEGKRREVETDLGVIPSEQPEPESDQSYLAAVDRIKQLYRKSRFEAALIELDDMLRVYSMDPKLYQMRGTLLDRIGKTDLAIKSWNQALKLDPTNISLKKFVERKQQKRSLASP